MLHLTQPTHARPAPAETVLAMRASPPLALLPRAPPACRGTRPGRRPRAITTPLLPTRRVVLLHVQARDDEATTTNPLAPLASTSTFFDVDEDGASSTSAASSPSSSSSEVASPPSLPGVKIDLGLPRRSRRVSFTCNKCDTRTDRMVNPRAWESGMVFVQCGLASCGAWHKVADAAGLVEEIRFDTEAAPVERASGAALEFEGEAAHALVQREGAPLAAAARVVFEVEEVEEA